MQLIPRTTYVRFEPCRDIPGLNSAVELHRTGAEIGVAKERLPGGKCSYWASVNCAITNRRGGGVGGGGHGHLEDLRKRSHLGAG